jgi:hypothetical protein
MASTHASETEVAFLTVDDVLGLGLVPLLVLVGAPASATAALSSTSEFIRIDIFHNPSIEYPIDSKNTTRANVAVVPTVAVPVAARKENLFGHRIVSEKINK